MSQSSWKHFEFWMHSLYKSPKYFLCTHIQSIQYLLFLTEMCDLVPIETKIGFCSLNNIMHITKFSHILRSTSRSLLKHFHSSLYFGWYVELKTSGFLYVFSSKHKLSLECVQIIEDCYMILSMHLPGNILTASFGRKIL